MKRTALRGVSALLLAGALFLGAAVSAAAADQSGTVKLYLSSGGSPSIQFSQGSRFFEFGGVVPGDTLTQNVEIENRRSERVTFYLKASSPENENVLRQLKLELRDGTALLYRGDLTGGVTSLYPNSGNLTTGSYGISLGQCSANGTMNLKATIEVPAALDNTYADALSKVTWEIRAELPDTPGTSSSSSSRTYNSGSDGLDGEPGRSIDPSTPNTTTIGENEVPLGDSLYTIPDDQVPLANLPKTGGGRFLILGAAAVLLLSAAAFLHKNRDKF